MKDSKITALITSTGSVAADVVLKGLKKMDFRIVGCNIYPREWIVDSCLVDEFYQAPPVSNKVQYLKFIKELCVIEKIRYILPMIDYEIDILSADREWFEKRGIILCISPKESVDIIRNKKKLADFIAKECPEITPIPTMMLDDVKELEWEFPVVCKPYNGRSSQGLRYIYSRDEWEEFRREATPNTYVVEPFIAGPRVVVEIVRQTNPHKVVAMMRRELIATSNGCSLTVFVYQDKKMEEAAKVLADKLNVWGDVNFEFILDKNGDYHFLECNPRFSAGCEFSCMAGYNCVENHLKCFMGKEIEDAEFKHNMIIARKYEEHVTAVDVDVKYSNTYC